MMTTPPHTRFSDPTDTNGTDSAKANVPTIASPAMQGLREVVVRPAVSATDPSATHLVVIRESTKYEELLLQGMAKQILGTAMQAGVPGVEEVLAAVEEGFLPWKSGREGDRWRTANKARPLTEPSGRRYGWTFQVHGTRFVLAATSATTMQSEDLGNPFTDDLIDLIRQTRPAHLWTGPASRLFRRKVLAEKLREAVNGMVVHTKETEFDFTANRLAADQMWTLTAMFSDLEVRSILSRTLLGKVHAATSGRWPEGTDSLPPTATLDETGIVVADPSSADIVRELVAVAADAERLHRKGNAVDEKVAKAYLERLAAAGMTRADGRRLSTLSHPVQGVLSRTRRLHASLTGWLERRQVLPEMLDPTDLAMTPVYSEDPDDPTAPRMIVLQWKIPTLEDVGINDVDPETLQLARTWTERVQQPVETAPERRETLLPLGDVPVTITTGPGKNRSLIRQGHRYVIVEHAEGTRPRGADVESTIVASIPWQQLHQPLVDAVIAASADGHLPLDAEALTPATRRVEVVSTAEQDQLTQELGRVREQLTANRAIVENAKKAGVRQELMRSILSDQEPVIAELEAEETKLADALAGLSTLVQTVEVDQDTVRTAADVLAILKTAGQQPPEVRQLIRQVVAGLTLAPQRVGRLDATVQLHLPTESGPVVTDAIGFTVADAARGYREEGDNQKRDRKMRLVLPDAFHLRMTTDTVWEDLTTTEQPRTLRRRLRDLINGRHARGDSGPYPAAEHPELIMAAIDAGPLSLRQTVRATIPMPWDNTAWHDGTTPNRPPVPSVLPGLDPDQTDAFVAHIRTVYSGGTRWTTRGWLPGGVRGHRTIAATVAAAGGTMPAKDLQNALNNSRPITSLGEARNAFERRYPALLHTVDVDGVPSVRLRSCPHADCVAAGPRHALPAPEVIGGAICTTCRRGDLPDITFPTDYLHDWEAGTRSNRNIVGDGRPPGTIGTARSIVPVTPAHPTRRHTSPAQPTRSCRQPVTTDGLECGRTAVGNKHYCDRHDTRTKRAKANRRLETRTCATCNDPVTYNGRGRPPTYCPPCRS